ncbi:MAG: 3-dehydroquinate synthase [Opitutae bacterium]|nr:3-dehydroquinate synthase [Opitutae bacterium]
MQPSILAKIGGRPYSIRIGGDVAEAIAAEVARLKGANRQSFLLCDSIVNREQAEFSNRAFGAMPRLCLDGGEPTKSLESLGEVLDFLSAQPSDRRSVLWVAGGGVIGDLGGFAAAVYLRGIDYVQVPTTLLAMVDSSLGGKTGLNLKAGKNLAGAFHQPLAVFIAPELLSTLPPREFAAGIGEVIKYGLLGDAALFAQLASTPLTPASPELPAVIRRCCEIKVALVQADERETAADDGRALLNLGHTFGHAVEQVTGYSAYLHGEAVAVGLVAAARLSAQLGALGADDVARVERVVSAHRLPVRLRAPLSGAKLMAAMQHDKKARAGQIRYVVLRRLGEAHTRADIDPALVAAVWRSLGAAD